MQGVQQSEPPASRITVTLKPVFFDVFILHRHTCVCIWVCSIQVLGVFPPLSCITPVLPVGKAVRAGASFPCHSHLLAAALTPPPALLPYIYIF